MKLANNYAKLKLELADLTEKVKEAEEKLLEQMIKNDQEAIRTPYGLISVAHYKTWQYSPVVESMKTKLKQTMSLEELNGLAEFYETLGLQFRKD